MHIIKNIIYIFNIEVQIIIAAIITPTINITGFGINLITSGSLYDKSFFNTFDIIQDIAKKMSS